MVSVLNCPISACTRTFSNQAGLTQHVNAYHHQHPDSEPDSSDGDEESTQTWSHPFLTAQPCDELGNYLPPHTPPPPFEPLDATPSNPWNPFPDRLAFQWADFYFSDLQASERRINKGLELWAAEVEKSNSESPWKNADDLFSTIDAIQEGANPWVSVPFHYHGTLPPNPPKWMTDTYELCMRNILSVLCEQISCTSFNGHYDYVPYRQFNCSGDRVWTNLMSGEWAAKQADIISRDDSTHGAMFVGVVAGSDKTVASVATGHQEFHPVYIGPGNIDNSARRAHGNGMLPCAILPIPKASQKERKTIVYQRFCRQLYHSCLAFLYGPLKQSMTVPEVIRCPDGHYRRAIFSIGPYIADYPEQVWLAGIVSTWCPKCDARPEHLDDSTAHLRTHEKADVLLELFDPGIVWDEYGLRSDVVPFTHGFPRADIHELITPDLLHQLIKGTFKDHLVTWVQDYILQTHTKSIALAIIQDIDRRISAVPPYPGLRRFPDGRDFNQWTGDDSKALMKVYLAAICGHVPAEMVRSITAFVNCCYLVRRNSISTKDLQRFRLHLADFHHYRQIFLDKNVRSDLSLPRQHALMHYADGIELFGSPNGLCTSITESKHIPAIKQPWRRSNRNKPLKQMLQTIVRLDKMFALRQVFTQRQMLAGSIVDHTARAVANDHPPILPFRGSTLAFDYGEDETSDNEQQEKPLDIEYESVSGPRTDTLVWLATRRQYGYPQMLTALADHISLPDFPDTLRQFIHTRNHPLADLSQNGSTVDNLFNGPIHVYHSATIQFYAPSELCGEGGMHREMIRSNPRLSGSPRYDTVFVSAGREDGDTMNGLLVARVRLLFSYFDVYTEKQVPCALVHWFVHPDNMQTRHPDTGMWVVSAEHEEDGYQPMQVIHLDTILRGAHLVPCFGNGFLPESFDHSDALDAFDNYFVNQFIDYHVHELLT
ncbi:hypothetical protein PC9H_003074 [Pleurotus ostreatus]|uniref:C2H2-type domain-containing protein n=1 Tax=Pleurotus ostreatus TaxID=5322 RepID=A0A8H7A553_PLEOS|nr:uncharacterized protein PC9H_003074 [Pleurotus ostreatus]KAF7436245.1 hypothetical protein PC9H_003074 [Pleurotus ostreatus]